MRKLLISASFSFFIPKSTCTSTPTLTLLKMSMSYSYGTDNQPNNTINETQINPKEIPSFFSDQTISPPDDDQDNEYDYESRERYGEVEREGDGEDVPPPRKKRAQVRVACTHCQKACKKCSNTRSVSFQLSFSYSLNLLLLPLRLLYSDSHLTFLFFSKA